MSSLAAQLRTMTLRTVVIPIGGQLTLQSAVQCHTGLHTNMGVIKINVGPSLLGSKNKGTTVTSPISLLLPQQT